MAHRKGAKGPSYRELVLRVDVDGGYFRKDFFEEQAEEFGLYLLDARQPWCLFHHQSDMILFV